MTNVLAIIGLVWVLSLAYALVGVLSYATAFRHVYDGRVLVASLWPLTLPIAAAALVARQRTRRRNRRDFARARVHR